MSASEFGDTGREPTSFWDSLTRSGWACADQSGAPDYAELDTHFARRFGVRRIGAKRVLSPLLEDEAPSHSLSGRFGLGAQPLHTDCATWPAPPRYLTLYGLVEANQAVYTYVQEFEEVELKGCDLQSQVWGFRIPGFRGIYGTIVCSSFRGSSIRFDPTVMFPKAQLPEVSSLLSSIGRIRAFDLAAKNWIVIDNWRCLHGRGDVAEASKARRLERQYWG